MFKLTPEINLKPVFLTGAITTATFLSPLMIKNASAISSCATYPGDVTSITPTESASLGCEDVSGPNGGNPDISGGVFGLNNWNLIAKAEGGNWSVNGVNVIGGGNTSGTWNYFSNSGSTLPLMIVLKGGTQSIAYSITPGSTSGTWDMKDFTTNGGQIPGLSNFSLYLDPPTPVPLETDALPVIGAAIFFGGGIWLKRRGRNVRLKLKDSTVDNFTNNQ